MFLDEFRYKNGEDIIDIMRLFLKWLIFNEVDFGLNKWVSEHNKIRNNTNECEHDLKGDLSLRFWWQQQENKISNYQPNWDDGKYNHSDL